MGSTVDVYLFGDQTYDSSDKLRGLLRNSNTTVLNGFFEQVHNALRAEIARLPLQQQDAFPRFATIAELLAKHTKGDIHAALQTALTCIYQLGRYISQHSDGRRPYPSPNSTYLLGLCAGGLPAAAISCARSTTELLPLAVHAVAVSFRLVLCAAEMRDRIHPLDHNVSWSILVFDMPSEEAKGILESYTRENRLPTTSKPYVTAYAPSGVTISGPPPVLDKLKHSPGLLRKRIITLPVYVTSHAPHLFSSQDVTAIMETTTSQTWDSYVSRIPVISCATGNLISGGTFQSVLRNAVEQCLRQPLRWDKINVEAPAMLLSTPVTQVRLLPVATKAEATLAAALREYTSSSAFSSSKKPAIEVVRLSAVHEGPEKTSYAKSKIAVCGLAGRFPGGANNPEAFWDLLHQGLDVASEVPATRWDTKTHVDPTGKAKNTSAVPWGCWLSDPEDFDPRFFGISPKEAPCQDPAQRLALMVAYESMEAAGMVPDTTPSTMKERIGVFVGISSTDWGETNNSQDIGTHSLVGGIRPFISGRVNYCHKFGGPSYALDTACSSSLAAMQLAVNALRLGDIDTAVAGGTNVITNPDGHAALDRGFFLSRTGNCKTFDDGADGYCRGEGIGLVLLKRLEDALDDGDPIQAVIVDIKTNHSAESDSITRPHAPTQIALFDKVFASSGVSPNEISVIEMHGTGTQHGDAAEMTSCLATFAPTKNTRTKDEPLYLGAAKANIGHGEAVSGITSVAKVILMMRHNTIPPHCGIKTKINHTFPLDLKDRNIHIAFKPKSWNRGSRPRKVLLNNFSAPGGNTAMIIEDAPVQPTPTGEDPRTSQIVAFSAKCGESLMGNMRSLLRFIKESRANGEDDTLVPSLSYTTTARRQHHIHRACITGASIAEIQTSLESAIQSKQGYTRAVAAPKIIFAFAGQGSQYIGMGKQLMAFSQFRDDINRFDQLAEVLGFSSFKGVLEDACQHNIESLSPVVVQMAIVCLEMALARLWISWGIHPTAVVGHSLGEYAALNIAGVLSDADTIYLVGQRAKLLERYCQPGSHAMLAVRSSAEDIRTSVAGRKFEIACINGPEDIVLGGLADQIDSLRTALGSMGVRATPVRVQYAFHTSQVDTILSDFATAAQGVTYNTPQVPVVSPLLGRAVGSELGVFGPDYLVRHCRETVNMHGALLSASTSGHKLISDKCIVIEIGAQPLVSGMVNTSLGPQVKTLPSLQRGSNAWPLITAVLTQLYRSGQDIKWTEYHRDFKAAVRILELPAYSWDLKKYWMQYTGDWSLRKGESLPTFDGSKASQEAIMSEKAPRAIPKIDSTTVHRILQEESDDRTAYILVESDISRPDLLPIVQGHYVNGIPLCTPSVFADTALTVGTYLLDRYDPDAKDRIIDVAEMEVERALIAKGKGPQMLRASAKVDWTARTAAFSFFSVDADGKSTIEHSTCKAYFRDNSQLQALLPKRAEQLALMDKLDEDVRNGDAFRVKTDVSFKMVAGLAKFHSEYRSTGEISLNGDTLEASSTANFTSVKKGGRFVCHPAYIDGFTQLAGFVMNAKGSTDLDREVYVNRGWDSFQIFKEVSPKARYRLYVKMAKSEGTMYKGDVMVLDDEGITLAFKGVALRGIPRKAFDMVLQAAVEGREMNTRPARAVPKMNNTAQHSEIATVRPVPIPSTVTQPAPATAQPLSMPVIQTSPQGPKRTRKPKADNSKWPGALAIILEETGLSGDELSDDSGFADMGVDSLLSMVINSRFKEELGLDVEDESNSVFITYPTIKHFKDLLGASGNEEEEEVPQQESSSFPSVPVYTSSLPDPSGGHPAPPPLDSSNQLATASQAVLPTATTLAATHHQGEDAPSAEAFQSILKIIAEETGVDIADLTDDCTLADVGIDSLLSMVVASRIREELSMELENENGFFVSYPTIRHIRNFCDLSAPPDAHAPTPIVAKQDLLTPETESPYESVSSSSSSSSSSSKADVLSISGNSPNFSESESEAASGPKPSSPPRSFKPCRPATSVILQGFPRTASKTLFLLPDGGGSSSSYVPLPRLETDTAIVGLNCPYGRDPENMQCHISDLMAAYVGEIRRRQPRGPYHVGGWSSGGVMAYIAAQLLAEAGDEVRTLLILDSPMPTTMDKLPPHFYDYCKAIGLFGDTPPPAYLLGHFDATVDVLDTYQVTPMPMPRSAKSGGGDGRPLRLAIIWAAESVADGRDKRVFPSHLPHNSVGLAFMVARRTDFGPAGWEKLMPDAEVVMGKVNANHFSMMQKPAITQVSKFIDRVMA